MRTYPSKESLGLSSHAEINHLVTRWCCGDPWGPPRSLKKCIIENKKGIYAHIPFQEKPRTVFACRNK